MYQMSEVKEKYYTSMFKEYPDVVKVKELKEMLQIQGRTRFMIY